MCLFSIVETEVLWNTFSDDSDSLEVKLTSAEREFSQLKVDETTFQRMKDILSHLKVTRRRIVIETLATFFIVTANTLCLRKKIRVILGVRFERRKLDKKATLHVN